MQIRHISWVAALALVSVPAWAQDEPETEIDLDAPAPSLLEVWPEDRIYGDPDAPVTIFEFSSLTCPHCAAFHVDTLPELKAELIDTGRANLVIRHFPLDQLAMNAALVAECVPEAQYYPFIDLLYTTQESWVASGDPMQTVLQTAMLAGVPQQDLASCMQDETVLNGILSVRLRAQTELGIRSTPTFYVGDAMIRGAQPFGTFAEAVEAAEAAAPPPAPADEEPAAEEPATEQPEAAPAEEAETPADGEAEPDAAEE